MAANTLARLAQGQPHTTLSFRDNSLAKASHDEAVRKEKLK